MSSSADTLNRLAEKLKETINEIQDRYESFVDSNQLYKQGKINERDFFASIGDYLVTSSSMNFITVQTILEMKSAVESNASTGDRSGQITSTSPSVSSQPSESETARGQRYSLPKPQAFAYNPLQKNETPKSMDSSQNIPSPTKDCTACGKGIPKQAKFCPKCGKSQ
jgi:hypothetical protein